MSLPSNGSLSLSEINRSVRFTNGNLGIGTTNPSGKLHVYDASTARIKIQTPNSVTQIISHSDTDTYFQSSGDIAFTDINTSGLRHLYLSTAGNVGIGTERPLTRLHVTSGVLIGSNSGDYIGGNLFWTGTSWTRGNSNAAGFALRIGNSGDAYGHGMQILTMDTANGFANRMLVGANGNVGIGSIVTNPAQRLEVDGRIRVSEPGAVSAVYEMSNTSGIAYLFSNPSGSVHLYPSNTSRNLILNADEGGNTWGSIGICTSNPNRSARLHVNASIFLSTGGSLWLTGYGDSAPNRLRLHQAGATGNGGSYIDFMGGPLCFRSGSGSLTTLLTLTTAGNLGLGTAPSSARLTVSGSTDMYNVLRVGGNSSQRSFLINLGAAGVAGYRSGYIFGDLDNMFILNQQNGYLSLFSNNGANGAEVRLTSSTNLGVGTNNPQSRLHIRGSPAMTLTTDDIYIIGLDLDSTNKTGGKFWRLKSTHQSASEGQGKFIIANETNNLVGYCASPNGAISIGTMTPANNGLQVVSYGTAGEFQMGPSNSNAFHMYAVNGALEHYNGSWGAGSYRGKWYNNGLEISGSLSKGSGSFDIQHPLHPDDSNKRLVHSFIEGPRCDLIYRGQVILVNGIATVNLDTDCVEEPECAMSSGTFEALCINPQILLQNVTSFSKIRGRINGNILTIECQDTTSTDIISWSVIAERKDPYIKSWERTNANGYLKTEYIQI